MPARRPGAGACAAIVGRHDVPRRARAAARMPTRDKDAYIDRVIEAMIPAVAEDGLADAVDAFCEGIGFSPRADRARVRARRTRSGLRGEAACRAALEPARRSLAGGVSARSRRTISNIPTRPASPRWRRPAPSRCCCRAPSTSSARPSCRRSALFRRQGVPIALATDCNPGTSPLTSLLLDDEHGRDPVPPDRGGMPAPASPATRRARSAGSMRSARSKPARAATSPSGTSSARPSWSTAWASTRSMRASGGVNDRARADPRRRAARANGAPSIAAPASALDPACRPADRRERGRGGAPPSSPRASRSMGSIPASVSSPACASTRTISATLQRNIVLSHAAGVGEPMPLPIVAADDGAEARQPRAGRLGRAAGDAWRCWKPCSRTGLTPVVPSPGLGGRRRATSRRSRT